MPYLRISEAQRWGEAATRTAKKDANYILLQESARFSPMQHYDVFLSHSFKDGLAILGIKRIMESLGLTVYVDWIEDPTLDRENVTVSTAELLRVRMKASSSLVYVHSANSGDSKWMPWELGYFDGMRPKFVWILPLVDEYDHEFRRQEYLCLYPAIEVMDVASWEVGRQRTLGFPFVDYISRDEPGYSVRLVEAARGYGVFLRPER